MEITKLKVCFNSDEVGDWCDRLAEWLRPMLPSFVTLQMVAPEGDTVTVTGRVDKLGCHEFSIVFSIMTSENGNEILAHLDDANITKWIGSVATVNAVLASNVPKIPGLSYSGADRCFHIIPSEMVAQFGMSLSKQIALNFKKGLVIEVK